MIAAYILPHNTQILDISHIIHEKDIKLLDINPNEFLFYAFHKFQHHKCDPMPSAFSIISFPKNSQFHQQPFLLICD